MARGALSIFIGPHVSASAIAIMPSARHIPLLLVLAPAICCIPCVHTWLCVSVSLAAALVLYVIAAVVGELRILRGLKGGVE